MYGFYEGCDATISSEANSLGGVLGSFHGRCPHDCKLYILCAAFTLEHRHKAGVDYGPQVDTLSRGRAKSNNFRVMGLVGQVLWLRVKGLDFPVTSGESLQWGLG